MDLREEIELLEKKVALLKELKELQDNEKIKYWWFPDCPPYYVPLAHPWPIEYRFTTWGGSYPEVK